jgi:hypothetical protein
MWASRSDYCTSVSFPIPADSRQGRLSRGLIPVEPNYDTVERTAHKSPVPLLQRFY